MIEQHFFYAYHDAYVDTRNGIMEHSITIWENTGRGEMQKVFTIPEVEGHNDALVLRELIRAKAVRPAILDRLGDHKGVVREGCGLHLTLLGGP